MLLKSNIVLLFTAATIVVGGNSCRKDDHNDRSDEVDQLQQKLNSSDSARAEAEAKLADENRKMADSTAKVSDAEHKASEAEVKAASAGAERDRVAALSAATESGQALDDASKRNAKLTADLKAAAAENNALTMATRVDTRINLEPFAGIWVADGDENMGLQEGCRLMYRVDKKPAQVLRFIGCMNGTSEISIAPVAMMKTEPSRFPGGFQLSTISGLASTSCGYSNTSVFPIQSDLAFDLKTAAGGAAALYSYTNFGNQEITLHSGGAIDAFTNNSDCAAILQVAQKATDVPADYTLRLAAKACTAKLKDGGCYVTNGYVAPSSN